MDCLDDTMLGVDVLELGQQYIHCRIHIRSAHLSVLATIIYGANDIVRRELWQQLGVLSQSIDDEPWVVGGDFNTVLDMSEVCGSSVDIHVQMNEFRDCIHETGLIQLPMRGTIIVKGTVACGRDWTDCLSMMLGLDNGRIRVIKVSMHALLIILPC
ncbi:UNVERIFIED_CONTAM: hypothetical protein Slati_0410600 [Sesamum latifolium]|uniref:Endonuclease/exonuclease/phosphatase domain-containing protein n=1 Tax=Sesamum latifolium TaxID=2727402 RepID=A0AAW2XUL9_9LAMI